jgi:hypothetical protein
MTESGAARPGDSQGRNLLDENLGEILASQTSHSSIEKRRLDAQAEPAPTAIKMALRRRSVQFDRIHTYQAPPEPMGVDRRCSGRSQWHTGRSFHVVDQIL